MKNIILSLFCVISTMTSAFAQQQVQATLTHPICNADGEITVTIPNNTTYPPPYTVEYYYYETIANSSQIITHSNVTNTDILTGYIGGLISIRILKGSQYIDYTYLNEVPFITSYTITQPNCPVLGSITIAHAPGSGTAPFSYEWTKIDNNPQIVGNTNPVYLPNGAYQSIITDANGCKLYLSDSFRLYNNNNNQITSVITPASCTNGSISNVNMLGGTPPFTYEWSNGANTADIDNLTPNNYTVTVTESSGCSSEAIFYVNQNPVISAQISTTPTTCLANDGSAIAFGTGGVPPYTYRWSNTLTTQTVDNLATGYHYVTVTDDNGCTGVNNTYIYTSSPILVNVNATPSECNAATGSATLTISGGTAPYTTTWGTIPAQTGNRITNKNVGSYFFKIVDAIGCEYQAYANIPSVRVLVLSSSVTPATCIAANGSIFTTISGGNAPYTYIWNNNATTANLINVPKNYYNVKVTDAGGCTIDKYIELTSSSPVSLNFSNTDASCIFKNDGKITAQATGGAAPYTYNNLSSNVIPNLGTGSYHVNAVDANGCTAHEYTFVGYDAANTACFCTIQGNVYKDANGNCTKENNEAGIQNIAVSCSGIGYAYTNTDGDYSFKVRSGTYVISEVIQNLYPLAACQQRNTTITIPATSTSCTYTADFANTILPIHDLKINTWSLSPPRPGFNYQQRIVVSNEGTINESDIYVGYRQSVSLPAAQWLSNALNQTITNHFKNTNNIDLLPSESITFDADYTVPTTTPLGSLLVSRDTTARDGAVTNWRTDYTPWDNVNYYQATVVGAYDPNFKEVSPYGTGATHNITRADTVMDYAVHFQNLGTYYAQDVVIVDTLDSDFDIKTLKPIYGSHPYTVKMTPGGIVTFTFKNINLPAKQNQEAASKGMITYSIHVKKNLANNTRLTNRAAIYFDFNAPIITNTAFNTIKDAVVGTEEAKDIVPAANFTLFPNPTNSDITIEMEGSTSTDKQTLSIIDMTGRVLHTQPIQPQSSTQTHLLPTASLPAGVYMVRLSANNNAQQTKKFVKVD